MNHLRVGTAEPCRNCEEICEANRADVGSLVAGVELGVGEAAAEGNRVLAQGPDGVGGRLEAVLENPGEGSLRSRASPMLMAALKARLVDVAGRSRRSSTMLMPGKKVEPKVLMVESASRSAGVKAPGRTWQIARR